MFDRKLRCFENFQAKPAGNQTETAFLINPLAIAANRNFFFEKICSICLNFFVNNDYWLYRYMYSRHVTALFYRFRKNNSLSIP